MTDCIVLFSDGNVGHPIARFLKKGFRHVAAVVRDERGFWVLLDPCRGDLQVRVEAGGDYTYAQLLQHYLDNGYTVVGVDRDPKKWFWPLFPANCVSFVKNVVGVNAPFVLTPYQLYRTLVEQHWQRDDAQFSLNLPGLSKPSAPAPPPLPPPPPPPPKKVDKAVVAARDDTRQQAALAGGRDANIFTSPLGLSGSATDKGRKALLGN